MDNYTRSLELHNAQRGAIETATRLPIANADDLAVAYLPGVARPCETIAADPTAAWDLSWKGRNVAVVSDGSGVLGLGDLGPLAALPVIEGKAALFRELGGVDAVPLMLGERDPDAIVDIVTALAPGFGAIALEDISAPRCFEIEQRLQDIGIPVLHDDQSGVAVALLAALLNACRATGRSLAQLKVVIAGAGISGRAVARLLTCTDAPGRAQQPRELLVCDSRGILRPDDPHNDGVKDLLALATNPGGRRGSLAQALAGADVFLGLSRGGLLGEAELAAMAPAPIVIALAFPEPEVDPQLAQRVGASVIGTGRHDLPNAIDSMLAFPGLFRGALAARAQRFTNAMKWAAVGALAACVDAPTPAAILPPLLERSVAGRVAEAVAEAARQDGVCHLPAAEGGPRGRGSRKTGRRRSS